MAEVGSLLRFHQQSIYSCPCDTGSVCRKQAITLKTSPATGIRSWCLRWRSCSSVKTFSSQWACRPASSFLANTGSWKTVNSSPQPSHRRVPISRMSGARSRVCPFLMAAAFLLVHNSIRLLGHHRPCDGAGDSRCIQSEEIVYRVTQVLLAA
jgi:hypothetical protein